MRLPQHLTTISRFVKSTFKSTFKPAITVLTLAIAVLLVAGTYMPHAEAAVTTKQCGFGSPIAGGKCRGYLTSTTTTSWAVPFDWSSNNTIECIGAGGNGTTGASFSLAANGGAGGAYAGITNLALNAGNNVTYKVAPGGDGHRHYLHS